MLYRFKLFSIIFFVLMAIGSMSALTGCGSDDPGNEDYSTQLYLPNDKLEFKSAASYSNLEVISSGNIAWEIRQLPSWVTASPVASSRSENVRITVEENTSSQARSDTFQVVSVSSAFPMAWKVIISQEGSAINAD